MRVLVGWCVTRRKIRVPAQYSVFGVTSDFNVDGSALRLSGMIGCGAAYASVIEFGETNWVNCHSRGAPDERSPVEGWAKEYTRNFAVVMLKRTDQSYWQKFPDIVGKYFTRRRLSGPVS
jgi:hypothetical protein